MSAVPTKIAANSWNCSVPYQSDFLFHLSCNLKPECRDAEDEADCSYTTDLCGPGLLTLGESCFFYLPQKDRVTWLEAEDRCAIRQGRLAVLSSVAKWRDAVKLLPFSKVTEVSTFVGIRKSSDTQPLWYRRTYQWAYGTTAFYTPSKLVRDDACRTTCGYLVIDAASDTKKGLLSLSHGCNEKVAANILCEKIHPESVPSGIPVNGTSLWPRESDFRQCPSGHYVHAFLPCSEKTSCRYPVEYFSHQAGASKFHSAPSFLCMEQNRCVPYTFVCDYRTDCADGSDEDFCVFPWCKDGMFTCNNKQCIQSTEVCDGWQDCYRGEDEDICSPKGVLYYYIMRAIPPPALVNLTSDSGILYVRPLPNSSFTKENAACPGSFFQCADNGYCLPMILRCNGVDDCWGREDEAECDTCPGFYRCRASEVCLLHGYLCDGHGQCPLHDDELMCGSTCPPLCVCLGLAFSCRHAFNASVYPLLRLLDASGTDMIPERLQNNSLLIRLIMTSCNLTHLDGLYLPNLLTLDVRDNQVSVISGVQMAGVPQLRELSLAGNPLTCVFPSVSSFSTLNKLDLSRVRIPVFNVSVLSTFPNLRFLNLSQGGVQRVHGEGFYVMEQLRVVDLRGCPMTSFPRKMFHGLKHLQAVHAQSFRLCCPAVLPVDFILHNCLAPSDEISSCDDLLRKESYSVCVIVLSFLAMAGNAVSFLYRTFASKRENKLGYGNFVTHLSVSDFLMGIYLAIIGVADQVYRGAYLWNDLAWRQGNTCKLAGFLSLLSSEASVLIMCLITTDRFLVLRFPFSQLRFSPESAHAASAVVWFSGLLLASVPLLHGTSHWAFYSQTSICIPLPITRTGFAGHDYSFSILVVFNFVMFLLISMGQVSIYWSIHANSMSVSNTTRKGKDLLIARRLITVAVTDFFCWFPIGVLGLLASNGTPIPGEVNVAVAIFVLPLNSAINPCLYTFNVILERRKRAREEKIRTFLLAQIKARD